MRGAKGKLSVVTPMKGDDEAVPPPLDFMSPDARDVWARLAPQLVKLKRLEPHFHELFASYCEEVAVYIAMTKDIGAHGVTYETGQGRNGNQKRTRPEVHLRKSTLESMIRLGALFGLSPVDEKRLGNANQGDLFEDLMRAVNGKSA
ncbi:P27 family predicted phage terminase small subunit [Rhodobacter sp. JA431]|nr:P27 family predicted phage terminase small subunit [Rhodobacter sp. JA431]